MTAPVAGLGSGYIGRFAPSPTGPLHAGSLVAALASWLDARAHGGQWLVRIEDVDNTRCLAGLDQVILQQLAACSLYSDLPPLYQSQRSAAYQQALDRLVQGGWAYPCGCSRQDIEQALRQAGHPRIRHGELVYPGSCRSGLQGRPARAWRFRTDIDIKNRPLAFIERAPSATYSVAIQSADTRVIWADRQLGTQQQDVTQTVGDFVLKRADGCFAYQLAVVVDDACQGVTDIVRGQDLADNTPRQILLQRALGLSTPRYLHTPLLLGPNGEKLSKQNGATALDSTEPMQALNQAARVLRLTAHAGTVPAALAAWVAEWVSLQGKATD